MDDDWITPQGAASLLGVALSTVYVDAHRHGWGKKYVGDHSQNGVLYWLDDVREELPNHGRPVSRWEA
jgi:hypothetical protein